jgi:hypothetical protein
MWQPIRGPAAKGGALRFPLGAGSQGGPSQPPLGEGHVVEVLPTRSTYINPPLGSLGSFIHLSNSLLSGLAPTFGVVPAS